MPDLKTIEQQLFDLNDVQRADAGLLHLAGTPQADYFELDTDLMNALNAALERREPWRSASARLLRDNPRLSAEYLSDEEQANFVDLFPASARAGVALDVGAGMILTRLAREFAGTVALEPSVHRLRFSQLRLRQEGFREGLYVHSRLDTLCLSRSSFSAIVVNGVLEWIPTFRPELPPRHAQVLALRQLRESLTPGGVLYLGIENCWSLHALSGGPEPHTGLRFQSVLPRRLADQLQRWRAQAADVTYRHTLRAQDRYRNYTYSHRGYRRLLREAGFESIRIWVPFPSYNRHYRFYESPKAMAADPAPRGSTPGWSILRRVLPTAAFLTGYGVSIIAS